MDKNNKEEKITGLVKHVRYGDAGVLWDAWKIGERKFIYIDDLVEKFEGKNIEIIIKVIEDKK
jgi:hypothetical protein